MHIVMKYIHDHFGYLKKKKNPNDIFLDSFYLHIPEMLPFTLYWHYRMTEQNRLKK